METKLVEDIGEKIGGAKKDLWSARGLAADDLKQMNDREADKYVKKEYVWKRPDYNALIASGIPVGVVYYMKKVRDSLIASPIYYKDNTPEKRKARQMQYIDTVRGVKEIVEAVRSVEDIKQIFARYLIEKGYYKEIDRNGYGSRYVPTNKTHENPTINSKFVNTLYVRSDISFKRNYTDKAEREQFGVAKEDKIPKGYKIGYHDSDHTYSDNGKWKLDTYYVTKNYVVVADNFATRAAALRWAQEAAKKTSKNRKKRFVPQQLINVQRTGPNYRNGREIAGEDYLKTFGFRGGEFGNWMTQNDRQESLNMGFDALKDLAGALKINERDISYQGTLAIAFGARGSGNAVAHYEPLQKVINLTKMRGAGSLAHEWWHGLDDYLGGKMGANHYLSECTGKYPLFDKLIQTMKTKREPPEQVALRIEKKQSDILQKVEDLLESSVFMYLKKTDDEKACQEAAQLKQKLLSGEKGCAAKLSELKRTITGDGISTYDFVRLEYYENVLEHMNKPKTLELLPRDIDTDFFRDSKKIGTVYGKDGGYWDSTVEMTARAFATYIMDKLPYRSDYLCGHAECAIAPYVNKNGETEIIRAYPVGEERKAINAMFDELFEDLKKKGFLAEEENKTCLTA